MVASGSLYDVIVRPVITEKSSTMQELGNKVTFIVNNKASKGLIKKAVESIFGVRVLAVNVLTVHGKSKVFRGRPGKRSDKKKAIVTLVQGDNIDITAGR